MRFQEAKDRDHYPMEGDTRTNLWENTPEVKTLGRAAPSLEGSGNRSLDKTNCRGDILLPLGTEPEGGGLDLSMPPSPTPISLRMITHFAEEDGMVGDSRPG